MMQRHFRGYNFIGIPEIGLTYRWGENLSENPDMAPWPELADISISNYCINDCEYCYRSSDKSGAFMSLEDYEFLMKELSCAEYGPVFQVALGGGEPLLHPNFNEILKITREKYDIIPNYTTSGKFFNAENIKATKDYCGAIAISYDPYRDYLSLEELQKLGEKLRNKHLKVNIHFVVSEKTIPMATQILQGKYDEYMNVFNSIIFLTFKPGGRGQSKDSIKSPELLESFLKSVNQTKSTIKFGFDACFVPALLKFSKIDVDLIDSCECGFFSVYIDEKLNVMPCSFCNDSQYIFNLKEYSFYDIWKHKFSKYRQFITEHGQESCDDCEESLECRGRCPFFDELFLCDIIN